MTKNLKEIESALSELTKILSLDNERNWSRGINSALSHVRAGTEEDYHSAKSIYKTMCSGGAGFMEYYIKRDNPKDQAELNTRLDHIRDRLWDLFEC